jgi:hypothetical protein
MDSILYLNAKVPQMTLTFCKTSFLLVGLLFFTQSQTVLNAPRGREILRPGQVWQIDAITVSGQKESFTITTGNTPVYDQNGILTYADHLGYHTVDGIGYSSNISYDPVDKDPEFMIAQWIREDLKTYKTSKHYCLSWMTPEQKPLDFFQGKYADSSSILLEYAAKNDESIVGTCTIKLKSNVSKQSSEHHEEIEF